MSAGPTVRTFGWRCDLCPETGREATAAAARSAWNHHYRDHHYGRD